MSPPSHRQIPDTAVQVTPPTPIRHQAPSAAIWNGAVAPAQRSPTALAKTQTHRTPDGDPVYSLPDLIAELGTITRNDIQIASSTHTYKRTTALTTIQAKALALLATQPGS